MQVTISRLAERDLESIGDYIAEDNPPRAVSFVAELRAQCATIAKAPHAYRPRPDLGDGIRSCAHGNYVIFYRTINRVWDHVVAASRLSHRWTVFSWSKVVQSFPNSAPRAKMAAGSKQGVMNGRSHEEFRRAIVPAHRT